MKRFFFILIILFLGNNIFSQTTDSLCKIPIMYFEDTTFHSVIDTLLMLEKQCGTKVSNEDKISVSFIDTEGLYCMIQLVKDKSFGETIFLSMAEHVRIAYHNTLSVLILGATPYKKIMSHSGKFKMVECVSYSNQDVLYEDYVNDDAVPNLSLFAKWGNNHMHIYLITDKKGDVLYDSSFD